MVSEFGQVLTVSALSPARGLARLAGWRTLWRGSTPDFLDVDDTIAMSVYATMQMLLLPSGVENKIAEVLQSELKQLTSFLKLIALAWLYQHRSEPAELVAKRQRWLQDIVSHTLLGHLLSDEQRIQPTAMDSFVCLIEDERLREIAESELVVNTIWEFITRQENVGLEKAAEMIALVS